MNEPMWIKLIFEFIKKNWISFLLLTLFAAWGLRQNNQSNATKYYSRGLDYHEQKQYEQAIAEYDKAIHINPQFVEAYYKRGNAYLSLGKFENKHFLNQNLISDKVYFQFNYISTPPTPSFCALILPWLSVDWRNF